MTMWERVRHWLIEPVVYGYAVAGFVVIGALFGDLGESNMPLGTIAKGGAELAYTVALAVSFWRVFLGPLIRAALTELFGIGKDKNGGTGN